MVAGVRERGVGAVCGVYYPKESKTAVHGFAMCGATSFQLPWQRCQVEKGRWHKTIQLNARDTWQGVGSLPLGAGTATTSNFIVQYLLQRASQDPCLQQLSSGRDLQSEMAAQAIQVHAWNIRV